MYVCVGVLCGAEGEDEEIQVLTYLCSKNINSYTLLVEFLVLNVSVPVLQ
jgi:hypothetical protein